MGIPMAADWAVEEIFGGVCCADGDIEITANDGGGIRWAFSHNLV
jgi:hypothetical protein